MRDIIFIQFHHSHLAHKTYLRSDPGNQWIWRAILYYPYCTNHNKAQAQKSSEMVTVCCLIVSFLKVSCWINNACVSAGAVGAWHPQNYETSRWAPTNFKKPNATSKCLWSHCFQGLRVKFCHQSSNSCVSKPTLRQKSHFLPLGTKIPLKPCMCRVFHIGLLLTLDLTAKQH